MKFLSFLVNCLLAITLVFTSLVLIFDQTISAGYLGSAAKNSGFDQGLATAIPQILASQSSDDPVQQQKFINALQSTLTSTYVDGKLKDALAQFESVAKGKGNSVTLSFTDLGTALQAQGVDVKPDNLKVDIGADKLQKVSQVGHGFETAKLIMLVAALILLAASIAMSIRRQKYVALAVALLVSGVISAGFMGLLAAQQPHITANINFSKQPSLTAPVQSLINTILSHLKLAFGLTAGIEILIGIVTIVFRKRLATIMPGKTEVNARAK